MEQTALQNEHHSRANDAQPDHQSSTAQSSARLSQEAWHSASVGRTEGNHTNNRDLQAASAVRPEAAHALPQSLHATDLQPPASTSSLEPSNNAHALAQKNFLEFTSPFTKGDPGWQQDLAYSRSHSVDSLVNSDVLRPAVGVISNDNTGPRTANNAVNKIDVVYPGQAVDSTGNPVKPDFIIPPDGHAIVFDNPDKNNKNELVVGVVPGAGDQVTSAQKNAVGSLVSYLSERYMQQLPDGTLQGALNDPNQLVTAPIADHIAAVTALTGLPPLTISGLDNVNPVADNPISQTDSSPAVPPVIPTFTGGDSEVPAAAPAGNSAIAQPAVGNSAIAQPAATSSGSGSGSDSGFVPSSSGSQPESVSSGGSSGSGSGAEVFTPNGLTGSGLAQWLNSMGLTSNPPDWSKINQLVQAGAMSPQDESMLQQNLGQLEQLAATSGGGAIDQQTLSQLMPSDLQTAIQGSPVTAAGIGNPMSYFMTQFSSEYNPDGPRSDEDCGPTSLAMFMKHAGKFPPGVNPNDTEALITGVRQAMTGNTNHNVGTSEQQIMAGATAAGIKNQEIHGMSQLDAALASGQMVVADGNPGAPGAYGPTLSNSQYSHFNGGHFILVVGKSGNNYIINDPLSRVGTLTVTASQLAGYMDAPGAGAGVALSA